MQSSNISNISKSDARTSITSGDYIFAFQGDGNFVIYDDSGDTVFSSLHAGAAEIHVSFISIPQVKLTKGEQFGFNIEGYYPTGTRPVMCSFSGAFPEETWADAIVSVCRVTNTDIILTSQSTQNYTISFHLLYKK